VRRGKAGLIGFCGGAVHEKMEYEFRCVLFEEPLHRLEPLSLQPVDSGCREGKCREVAEVGQ
jgi:hypothetical protein